MSAPVVDARGLRRDFVVRRPAGRLRRQRRLVRAVDDVTLRITPGECVGYIGANGAGKSTTIKMLTGILVPTAGELRVCGLEPVRQRRELARRIGVVFGQRSQLWWDLPLAESFRLLAAIHRLDAPSRDARLERCVELLDMASFLDIPVRQLSLGQRMRGEVTAALLHSPELLLLDEPTVGLDVVVKKRLQGFLRDERRAGTTILLATHDLADIERLCDRILVVDAGRMIFDGDLSALVAEVGARRVLVVDLFEPAPPLHGVPGAELVAVDAGGLRQQFALDPDGGGTAAAVLAAVAARAPLRDLSVREPRIEDVVSALYRRSAAR